MGLNVVWATRQSQGSRYSRNKAGAGGEQWSKPSPTARAAAQGLCLTLVGTTGATADRRIPSLGGQRPSANAIISRGYF